MRDNLSIASMGQSQNLFIQLSDYIKMSSKQKSLNIYFTYKIHGENSLFYSPKPIGEIIVISIFRTIKNMLALPSI